MSAPGPGLSPRLAVAAILKGMMGAGVLSLPYVFGLVGLAFAVPGYLVVAAICCFSVWRIIQCEAILGDSRVLDPDTSTDEAMSKQDFGLGPLAQVAAHSLGLAGVVLAAFGIIVSQLGFCVAYVDIIITTLLEPNLSDKIPESVLRVGLGVVLCLLSSLRKLDSLAKISVLALAVYAYLLVILPIRWGTEELTSGRAPSLGGVWGKFEPGNLGLWLGTSIFAQEAVVVSQCVYQDMRLRDHRAFRPILVSSFVICSVASTALAAFGCMCYGDSVKQVFYLNFPASSLDVTIAETILCLVLLPTFVIQLYPVARCFDELLTCAGYVSLSSDDSDETLEDSEEGRGQSCLVKVLARWLLVIITCVVAAVVPDLACISGYSGSFAMSVIGFFLPPLCHLKLHHFRVSTLDWILDVGLLAVGVTALVLGVSNTHCGAE